MGVQASGDDKDKGAPSSSSPPTDPQINTQILIAHSNRFASIFNYDWNLIEQAEEAIQTQEAQRKDSATGSRIESEKLLHKLEQRRHTLYRHRIGEESYSQQALAMAARAPAELLLEPSNIKDGNRFDHLIFNHENKPYYIHYTELKKAFSINLELDRYRSYQSTLSPAVPASSSKLDEINVDIPEDAYLQTLHKRQAEGLIQNNFEADDDFEIRKQHYATYDNFLGHLQQHKSTILSSAENAIISPLYICYLRRKRQLLAEKEALEKKLGLKKKVNLANIIKTAQANGTLASKASGSDHSQAVTDEMVAPATLSRLSSVATHFQRENATAAITAMRTRLAIVDAELDNHANYEKFLMMMEQSQEIANNDEFAAYGQFIEEEIKKLNIKHYGWGNKSSFIRVLRPNNRVAFVNAALNSAPGVSLLTVIAKLVQEENVTLSFGIAANVLLIPLFFWTFHESVEIAKYQNENHGRTPDSDSPILHKIKKDSMVLAGQTFSAAILGTLVMNRELQSQIGFHPIESLINAISPGSLVSGALTGEARAAALRALPAWVNLTAILVCGVLVGTLMAAITAASTWKDEEFNWTHVGTSFGLGFAAGTMMYTSCLLNMGNDKILSDFFGLVINGLLGLGLHLTVPKNRYQTSDQKEAAAQAAAQAAAKAAAANEGTGALSCLSMPKWMKKKQTMGSLLVEEKKQETVSP